jgi:dTDP-4-dehydrorhamnose reductase
VREDKVLCSIQVNLLIYGMTLLVTGIHGLVGQYLIRALQSWHGKLIITGRGGCRIPAEWLKGMTYEEMDITDPKAIRTIFDKHKPDAVIHSAAEAQPDACELDKKMADLVNVHATALLLEASKPFKSFFTYVSTDFIFSGSGGPYQEDDLPSPVNYYGLTKLKSENLVQRYEYPWAIVRTVLVYGNTISGTRSNIISWVRGELEKNKAIRVVGDQVRTPTFAGDLAKALLLITEQRAKGIWHISGKDVLTPYDIAIMVADRLKFDKSLITKVDASSFQQPAVRPQRTPFDISKARRELGYEPISFAEGMEIVISSS